MGNDIWVWVCPYILPSGGPTPQHLNGVCMCHVYLNKRQHKRQYLILQMDCFDWPDGSRTSTGTRCQEVVPAEC